MKEEIKGVKLTEEQQEKILKYKEKLVDDSSNVRTFLDIISEPNQHIVYMSESFFNFVYELYRSNDERYCNLINENTLTYNSFMESIDSIVADYFYGYTIRSHKIILVFDTIFNFSGQLSIATKMFKKFHECCLKKGIKNTPKDFNIYDTKNMFIYTLGSESEAVGKFYSQIKIVNYIPSIEKSGSIYHNYKGYTSAYYWFAKSQASSYFSNINNTISLYNIIKDDKQLQQIFSKLENLHFKKETLNTQFSIRNTFVRPVKNEKGEFVAFYSICFVESKEYQDIRIEPYVFMPNISVNESKIPERFNNLINKTALSRFETINLLVNYNLLLLLNDECNLNMTKDNMDIDKISLWFGSREYTEPTFVDLLTDYNKPLYSFQEMDNILKNEALNVLGNGNQELLAAIIKDYFIYLKTGNPIIPPEKRDWINFENEMACQKGENNLFSKINICDNNFSFVIAQMYRYMNDGLISCMHSSMNRDKNDKWHLLSNNYVPTASAGQLVVACYYEYFIALCRIDGAEVGNLERIDKYIDKLYYNDKHLAFELKELAAAFDKAHYRIRGFMDIFDTLNKDYVLEKYENYPSNKYKQILFLYGKWLREAQKCETMLIRDRQIDCKWYGDIPKREEDYEEGKKLTK